MPSLPPGYLPVCILPLYVIARALHEGLPAEGAPTFDLKSIGGYRPALFTTTNEGKRRSYGLVSRSITPSAIGVELSLQPRALERPAPRPGRILPPPPPVPNGAVAPRPEPAPEPPPPVSFKVTLVPPYQDCLQSEQLAATTRLGGLAGLPRTAHSPRPTFEAPSFGFPEIAAKLGEAVANALYDGAVRTTLHEVTGDLTPIPQRFWRTDEGEAVLADHSETVVPLVSNRQARGWAIVEEAALDAVWRSVTGRRLAAPAPGAGTAGPQPSPWEALIRELAFSLEYSGGLPLKNKSLSIDDVLVLVREKWDEKVFGHYRKGLARALATFVLHPDVLKGGKPTQAEIRERTRLRVARRRKEAREKAKAARNLPG